MNDRTLEQIRDDRYLLIQNTINDFENFVFPKYISNYKTYLWFMIERYLEIESWQSNVTFPLVASTVDTVFSNVYDFWFKFNIEEKALQELCNKAFDFRQAWKNTIAEAAKETLIIGKSFVRDFFIQESYTENFINNQYTETFNLKTPSLEYVSAFDIFYDRNFWCLKSPFKIIREYLTWEVMESRCISLWRNKIKKTNQEDAKNVDASIKAQISSILLRAKDNNARPFSYYNANLVKDLTYITPFILNKMHQVNMDASKNNISWSAYANILDIFSLPVRRMDDQRTQNNFFLQKNQSTFEVITYTTKDEHVVYVNWEMMFEWKKQYNIWEIREISYSNVPGTWNSQWLADTLWSTENIMTWLWNGFLDNMKLQIWDMFEVSWSNPFLARSWKLQFEKFGMVRTSAPGSLRRIELWIKDFTPVNTLQVLTEFAQQRSWVNQYISGSQWRAERVAWGIDVIINQYRSRLTPITDSINKMMSNVARSWVMCFLKYYSKNELKELWIIVEEDPTTKKLLINKKSISEIVSEDKISFSFDALHKIQMENNRAVLKDMMQYILQYASNKIDLVWYTKALLWYDFNIDDIFNKDLSFGDAANEYSKNQPAPWSDITSKWLPASPYYPKQNSEYDTWHGSYSPSYGNNPQSYNNNKWYNSYQKSNDNSSLNENDMNSLNKIIS